MASGSFWDLMPVLIEEAKIDDGALSDLLAMLEVPIRAVASRISRNCEDDAVQAALIKIWKNLDKIDLQRPNTIRGFIFRTATTAIWDEGRAHVRATRGEPIDPEWVVKTHRELDVEFNEYANMYLQYVRMNGTMAGAHQELAKRMGVCISSISSKFHEKATGIRGNVGPGSKDVIVESILAGDKRRRTRKP